MISGIGMMATIGGVHMASTMSLTMYSHQASALSLTLTLPLMFDRNTLMPIAPFTPSISISVNTNIENQMGSGPIQKRQR